MPPYPEWVQPSEASAAPGAGPSYEQLLAQMRLRLLQQQQPPQITIPEPPAQPPPKLWESPWDGGDDMSDLPPGMRDILDRMSRFQSRAGTEAGGGRAGQRDNEVKTPDWEGSFGDWFGTSLKGLMSVLNPVFGLTMAGKYLYNDYQDRFGGGKDFTDPAVAESMQRGGLGRAGGVGTPGVGGGLSRDPGGGGGRGGLDRESRAATGERTSNPGGMGGL